MTRFFWACLLFANSLFTIVETASGSDLASDPVKAELISSVDAVTPGQPFYVGVRIKIQPHWHVYWKFSGDAGLPTRVIWKLPDGWTVGPLEWPLPERFIEKGPLTTYGYADSVMLTATITPPANATGTASLYAKVDWMVCEEACIPGRATVALNLPVGNALAANSPPSRAAKHFERWRHRLPAIAAADEWSVDVKSLPDSDENNAVRVTFSIKGTTANAGQIVDWFPAAAKNFAIKNLSVKKSDGMLTAEFVFKSFAGPIKPGERLESLVISQDATGTRRASTLMITLNQ